jgi:transcriptional regulator with XRE-family HTH domain
MATVERPYDRGKRRGVRLMSSFGNDLRDARVSLGLSQAAVASAVRMPASKISRIERSELPSLSIIDAALIASAVGLDLSLKTYPGGGPIRDAAQARRINGLLAHVAEPLLNRTEAPLPQRDGVPDQRSWDALISDADEDIGVELEVKLYDAQAQTRRIKLKWRDSGVARCLLVVADTKHNRRVLREFSEYFAEWPRLATKDVLDALEAGRLPPTGLILF